MATGDQTDFVSRLRATLPGGWFANTATGQVSQTPILDALLTGLGSAWAGVYGLLAYATNQTRIATATDSFLDMIAEDFFALGLVRLPQETDAAFSARIRANLLPDAVTRAALIARVTMLTGRAPVIFEPSYADDTGGYGHTGMTAGTRLGYGVAGGYGSINLPGQFFITAYRPHIGGIPVVAPYASAPSGSYTLPSVLPSAEAVFNAGELAGVLGGTGGTNLLVPPTATVVAPSIRPAQFYPVLQRGAITGYVIVDGGEGYPGLSAPITLAGPTASPGGYGDGATAPPSAESGYSAYQSLPSGRGIVDDALIYATIAATVADGVTAWTRLAN